MLMPYPTPQGGRIYRPGTCAMLKPLSEGVFPSPSLYPVNPDRQTLLTPNPPSENGTDEIERQEERELKVYWEYQFTSFRWLTMVLS